MRQRSAYTLIEMLIASVLVAALMSVVWGMMSMYNSFLTAGQSQAVEQQLIRSVLQLLTDDLQSAAIADTNPHVTLAMTPASESPTTTVNDLSELSDLLAEELAGPSLFSDADKAGEVSAPGRVQLSGNSHSVRLTIDVTPPDLPQQEMLAVAGPDDLIPEPGVNALDRPAASTGIPADDMMAIEGIAPEVPEFRTVIWQFQPFGMISSGAQSLRSGLYRIQTESLLLQTALSQQETLTEQGDESDTASVDRMTLETLLFPRVDSRSETAIAPMQTEKQALAAPQFDVIPEIVGCQFEYFSGSAWTTSWDSQQQQGLPLAIRIRLRLVTADNLETLSRTTGTTTSQETPLDNAINAGADAAAGSMSPQTIVNGEESTTDPFAGIATRKVQRIILLQPVTGSFPQPGGTEVAEALP